MPIHPLPFISLTVVKPFSICKMDSLMGLFEKIDVPMNCSYSLKRSVTV